MAVTGSIASPSSPALTARSFARSRALIVAALFAVMILAVHVVLACMGSHTATVLWGDEFLFNVLLNVAILALSLALGRRLAGSLIRSTPSSISDALALLGLGFGAISLCILGAGLLHLLYWQVIAAAGIALCAWLRRELWTLWRAVSGRPWLRQAGSSLRAELGPAMQIPAIVIALAVLFAFLRSAVPLVGDEQDFDGVSYHVVAPKLYLAAHHIFPVPDIPLANAPSATEMFSILGLMAGTDMQMKVLNLCFSLLLGLAVYDFTRRHLMPAAAPLAVMLLYLPIWIVNLMSSTVPDFATTFFAVLCLDSVATWISVVDGKYRQGDTRHLSRWSFDREDWLLPRAGLLAGLAVSCKLTSAPLLPAMLCAFGVACLTFGPPGFVLRLQRAAGACFQVGIFALVPLAPWLLKNLAFFGNPFYPISQVSNGTDCTGATETCAPSVAAASTHMPSLLHQMWQPVYTVLTTYWGYCGPLVTCIVIAAYVLRTPASRFCLTFLVLGAVAWLKIDVLYYPPRYWLPMLTIGFALSAGGATWLLDKVRTRPAWSLRLAGGRRSILDVLLAAYLGIASLWLLILSIGLVDRTDGFQILSGGLSRYEFLAQRVRPYRAMDWVNAHAGARSEVATVNTSLGYYLQEPYLSDWFGTRLGHLQAGGAEMRSELTTWCAAKVSVVVFNRGVHEYNWDVAADIRPRSAYPWLETPGLGTRLLFTWRGVDVLAVHPCSALPHPR